MVNIIGGEDCGNSPKNLFLRDLIVAMAERDVAAVLDRLSDDFHWHVPGVRSLDGKESMAAALQEAQSDPPAELRILNVITHGKAGALNSEVRFANGRSFAVCDVVEFNNAKGAAVRTMTSYVIDLT